MYIITMKKKIDNVDGYTKKYVHVQISIEHSTCKR